MSAMPPTPPGRSLTCDDVRELAAGFVLGALEPDEAEAVRDHLSGCAQPHPEFAELGGVVPYLTDTLEPIAPSAALKHRILGAVRDDATPAAASDPAHGAGRPVAGPAVEASPASIDVARTRRRSPVAWIAAVAAVLVIVGLGAWNLQLRASAGPDEAYRSAVDRALAVATSPGGQAAILAPAVPGGPAGLAGVGADGSITVAMHGLDATSGSAVYEAWLIGSDQQPVPIGSFTVGSTGQGTLEDARGPVEPGVVIALTLEPRTGMTSPTMPIVASGRAGGPG